MQSVKLIRNYFKFKKPWKASAVVTKKSIKINVEKRTKSIKLTIFLMRVLGLWHASKKIEKVLSNILLVFSLIMMIYDVFSQFKDLYSSWNDFKKFSFVAPLAALVTTEVSKMIIFTFNRDKVMRMNKFIDEHFWKKHYNKDEIIIFNYYDNVCTKAITVFFILGQCVSWHYLLLPAFEKNDDGIRKLPFTVPIYSRCWHESPFYEFLYVTMILGTTSLFFCTITFASYVFSMCLSTAAQFKMLSQKLTLLCDFENPRNERKRMKCQLEVYDKLKECIKRHQMLILLTKEIENLYCYILLGQMIGSVMEICFCGLQILFGTTTLQRQILSINLLLSVSIQLYLFCYSSHEVYLASENVARAVYSMKWYKITNSQIHKDFALSVQIIAHRARRPCILSVGKFYPLSLETFASVLGTSMSHFMVLRKIIE